MLYINSLNRKVDSGKSPYYALPPKSVILKEKNIRLRKSSINSDEYIDTMNTIVENYKSGKYTLDEYAKIQASLIKVSLDLAKNINGDLKTILSKEESELNDIVRQIIETKEIRIKEQDYCISDLVFCMKDIHSILSSVVKTKIPCEITIEELKLLISDQELFQKCIEGITTDFYSKTTMLREIDIISTYIKHLETKIPEYIKNEVYLRISALERNKEWNRDSQIVKQKFIYYYK